MGLNDEMDLDELTRKNTELSSLLQQLKEQNEQLQSKISQTEAHTSADLDATKVKTGTFPSDPSLTAQIDAVGRVSIKFPPFWPEEPDLWFSQIEAQFGLNRITSESTRYSYVVANLEGRWANEIKDLIRTPPANEPYSTVKKALVDRLSKSAAQRVRQLIGEAELGDNSPSQFLRRLKSLAGSTPVNDEIMRTLWLQRLPHQVQAILQAQPDTLKIEDLATIADRIVEAIPVTPTSVVYATSAPPSQQTEISDLSQTLKLLTEKIEKIELKIEQISKNQSRRFRGRSRSRTSKNADGESDLCYYHQNFGDKAYKCEKPCNYNSTNSNGTQ